MDRRHNQAPNDMTSILLAQQSVSDDEYSIDLIELGYELLDKLKYIVLVALIGMLISGVYVFKVAEEQYEAVSKLYILNSNDSVVNLSDLQLGNYLASDYREIFNTWEVKEMVRRNLNLPYTYDEMEKMLTISNPKDTRIIYIAVTSPNPQEAVDMANEYAVVVSDYVSRVMAAERPNTLSEAILPQKPVSPKKVKIILLGMLLGIALSAGLITLRFVLDDSIRSADDIEKYANLSVLSVIPVLNQKEIRKINRGKRR
ncbi:MAG: hypothetical protein IKU38_02485 [Clostridia bacterium]|nr:hypothetical protein [Clostridia bacterium]